MSVDTAPLVPPPINTSLPKTLTFLSNPISYYFNAAPPYNNVALGALLFTPPLQVPRLLLLQKVGGTDPHAFSHFWQIPSGSPIPSDPTMLHALARIILNQTGLRLTSVYMMSGTHIEPPGFETEKAQRMRMLFMVEVAELGSVQLNNVPFKMDFGNEFDINSVPIFLNSSECRQHTWSTEADLKEFINSGLYPAEEKAQYRMMLEAFVFHKQNLAYLDAVNRQSRSAITSHGLHI